MEFCPTCGTLLQYELPYMCRPSRFFCPTCPYVCYVENKVKIKRKHRLVRKEIEPVISQDDMKGAPTADGTYFPTPPSFSPPTGLEFLFPSAPFGLSHAQNAIMIKLLTQNFRLDQLMSQQPYSTCA
ncbi:uncharacterized protein LOC129290689 isoform X1 [Prosopis cineraria]|uniref:uncharacterized protein LOC129290689 isoform X1 n=1 Tax=Prosopis cineraria TaxID=364024 RepID=UPI00240F720D|nr:uncharacterized protein LOC129290689 isoform X1 [Prosopis cineraria]